MLTGDVAFAGRIASIELNEITQSVDLPPPVEVTFLSDSEGNISLKIHLDCVASEEEGLNLAQKGANLVANVISFHCGKAVETLRLVSKRFASHATNRGMAAAAGSSTSLSEKVSSTVELGEAGLTQLISELAAKNRPGEKYYGVFRAALTAGDPASKFLGLYQILALITGDVRQRDICDLIMSIEPTTPESPRPPKNANSLSKTTINETVYTRLRNEYAHGRSNSDLERTRDQMEVNLDTLISIVKEVIRRQR